MMHRLIRITVLAALLLLLLVSVSVWIGRQQSAPSLLSLLRLADCSPPCWIGIVPGKTTLDEARDRIRTVYGSIPDMQLAFDPGLPPAYLWVRLRKRDDTVGMIRIRLDTRGDNVVDTIDIDFRGVDIPGQAALADVYALYGTPQSVALLEPGVNSPNDLALIYGDEERGAIVFASPTPSMAWTQPASLLVFYADGAIPLARSVELWPWRGFRKLSYAKR